MTNSRTLFTIQSSTNASFSSHFTLKKPSQLQQKPFKKLTFNVLCSSQSSKTPQNSNPISTLVSIIRVIPDWADKIQEGGMRKKRSLYNHETWVQHRSSLRHVRHLFSSFNSRVILSLIPPVIAFTSFAIMIASYNSAVSLHWLPEFFPVLRASPQPYQLTAPALALLLVFRTEASYSRFETGKKAWTKVIAGTNDLARQVIGCVDKRDDVLKEALLQYIMAFPVALKCHILYGSDMASDLKNLLEADDLAVVLSSKHRPRCIIGFISQSLQSLNLDGTKRSQLESKISCFHEGIGVCEQLVGIPIPLSYTRLTSRFLVLWHLTLPIILWDDCHWIVVPATFISAASLFCIEEVGVLIEEPFPMLALDELCQRVRDNIQEAMANEKQIQERLNSKRKRSFSEHSPNGWPTP
ncbi:voltage-dependent chloride channel 1, chloroplastic-like [Lycium barbarum]|uniref:voltage-dependent chloride channel 1, chloroplastic-like n=1 Tax=Lycium barbarum TaxID=112863 RepID=UPI00293F26D4|nr:voltage-dependent chloride channel 1, chloroplastic-like [Lycium barbarum]